MKTKVCSKCGQEKKINDFYYHRVRKHHMGSCKECNSKQCLSYQTRQRKEKSIKFIAMMRATEIKRKCKQKNIPFDSDIRNLLIEQWEKQKGFCFYSGRPMSVSGDYHTNLNAMTVDKIDPKLGYVKDNIVMCCRIFNGMKQSLNHQEFLEHCKEVLLFNENLNKSCSSV